MTIRRFATQPSPNMVLLFSIEDTMRDRPLHNAEEAERLGYYTCIGSTTCYLNDE
jgi:hypothetical protein